MTALLTPPSEPVRRFLVRAKPVFAAVLLCGLLAGCAIISKPPELAAGIGNANAWQAHKQRLAALDTWSIQGRVATGQLLGWTGNLSWRQRGERFDVRLTAPLGAGGFYVFGTLEHVTIHTRDKKFETAQPEQLVRRILGWQFPLRPLRYWAKGMPAPDDYQTISVDEQGRLKRLQQRGWEVSYLEYARQDGQPTLPKRIVLDNGETRIRLVVTRWFNLDGDQNKAGN